MKRFLDMLKQAHAEEKGAEGLEKLLIIGAIVLPLLGVLIFFRNDIKEWLTDEAQVIRGDADNFDHTDSGF